MKSKRTYRVTHYDPNTWQDSCITDDLNTLKEAKTLVKERVNKYPFKYKNAFIKIEKVSLLFKLGG